ncbi:MAG: tripartite tricarboxylate transporter substrate binding protein, partial [Rubritepida sp.]|nr:tripartite tricarboxylate transporter substrate binding protein [Rubritepida sp.]
LGQRFVVDNRPGAGGTIAALAASREAPDGYNLLLSNSAPITTSPPLYPQAGYDPVRSFTHVTFVGAAPIAIVVNSRFIPATDLPSLIAWMRAQPNPPSYGSSGTGSVGHILAEMFQRATGITLTHVPYRGSAALLPDLLNGQVPLAFDTLPQYVEHFGAGRLTGIAVSSPQRNPMAPSLPTLVETGQPNLIALNWVGISGPAGLPPAIVERLNAATLAGLQTDLVKTRLQEHAITPTPLGPAEFTAFVQRDVSQIGGMIRALGITAG